MLELIPAILVLGFMYIRPVSSEARMIPVPGTVGEDVEYYMLQSSEIEYDLELCLM